MYFTSTQVKELIQAVKESPVLSAWIRPEWHDPRPLAEHACTREILRWVSADDFFDEAHLDALQEAHRKLELAEDDVGLLYHSHAARVDKRPEVAGTELLLDPLWHRYTAYVLGATLWIPGRTVIKYRRHPPGSRGFWPHTDRDHENPKALAVLGYLNRGWRAEDGGLLQLWEMSEVQPDDPAPYYWDEWDGRALEFLERDQSMIIEAADVLGVRPMRARRLDQIVPRYNRIVFMDFQTTPSFHSITPTGAKPREGFVQWLY